MKKLLFLICVLNSFLALAQKNTFDIVTYTAPVGWTPEIKDFAASYTKTNNKAKSWCRITIYKSIKSSGDPTVDYTSEWNTLMVKNNWGQSTPPTPEIETEDGWTSNSGVSPFTFENKEAYSLLSTISGYGVEVSIVVLMNTKEFMKDVEKMLFSMDLQKPEVQSVAPVVEKVAEQPAQSTVTSAPGNQGISMSTTNFDDGWVAQPFADYVRVAKGSTVVLLHYGIGITDEMRASGNIEGVLFDRVIQPRYVVSNLKKYDNGGPCYFCIDFFEADVIEKATGKKYYLGFRTITNSGVSKCIEIISPSAGAFQQEFSDQKKIEAMLNYNKFAVASSDLVGNWDESTGSYLDMYNTVTGSYAGMNTTSASNSFMFNSDGTYNSRYVGAFGMIGDMKVYDQKYKGDYAVTPWEITLTKQFEGKPKIYMAQFEAVRGGRVLHLTDKQSSGMQYHLVKTK
ncbi:MAG: hypothetical protein KBF45_01630 [Cyclobacteriaceae bacterium]|nr:hypothetical protein [Cyclobacteriaceae bacterium]